jgi:NitT/TauT family transport system ATP-binding protein
LGFATVAQGDITLTPLGETFAEASILARKDIFAMRIRRLPMVQWLLAMLKAADVHRLEKDVVSAALALDFPPEEAERQVDVAINWGRYAELWAYDDTSASLYLEPSLAPESPPP